MSYVCGVIKTNKMKTLEEVKEHFKNAKEVKCLWDGVVMSIEPNTIQNAVTGFRCREVEGGWIRLCDKDKLAEIISYKDEYPKVMLVWEAIEASARKRVVIGKYDKGFLAWTNAESINEVKEGTRAKVWNHAKDLPTIKEVTLEEVAEKFNVSVENLRIKE